ncbi:hypothetical protein JCM5296_005516 [Sporobolomyces johnsonii]
MASWLPSFTGIFSFAVPSPVASTTTSTSDPPRPSSPSTSRPRRFPAPPPRGAADPTDLAVPPTATSGHKRGRGWMPGSMGDGDGSMLSPTKAEAVMDTPRAYYGAAADGVEPGPGYAGATEVEHDDDEDGRQKKRRKGMLGTALSTALDAAVFASALSYSAYQLWKNPPTHDDIDAHLRQKRIAAGPNSPLQEAPPPYHEINPSQPVPHPHPRTTDQTRPFSPTRVQSPSLSSYLPGSPSQIPRRIRHAHEPRPRPSPRPSFTPIDAPSLSAKPSTSQLPYDPLASLAGGPLPDFQPLSSPRIRGSASIDSEQLSSGAMEDNDDDEDLDGDPEMQAVSERLKALIEMGRDALVSRPKEWDTSFASPSQASTATAGSRSRLSTTTSTHSTASTSTSFSSYPHSPSSKPSSLSRASLHSHSAPRASLPNFAAPPSPRTRTSTSSSSSSFAAPTSSSSARSRRQTVDLTAATFAPPHSPASFAAASPRSPRSVGGATMRKSQSQASSLNGSGRIAPLGDQQRAAAVEGASDRARAGGRGGRESKGAADNGW